MAENIKRHVTHIKSKVVESGLPKLPTASQIQEGEIAVNYAKGYETLSMKNESGDVVTFETKQLHYGTCATAGGTNKKVVTVDGPFVLKKGVTVAVKFTNSNTTASTNVTLNVNNTGDYPIYYQAAQYTSSATTVCGAANYIITYMFNGTQWAWISINYLDGNSDTVGYSLRYGSNIYKAYSAIYRYMILLTKGEDTLLPVTTASNVTANTKTITTESFDPFGKIFFYSATSTTNASAAISNGNIWDRYTVNLTYSFNVASVLTTYKDVYLVAQMQSDGTAKLRNPSTTGLTNSPITHTLPSSDDGYIYILLGKAYSTTAIQLCDQHPIYYYKDGAVREYTKGDCFGYTTSKISAISGSSTGSASKTITAITQSNGVVTPTYANISITKSQISDFPTIPTVNNGTFAISGNGVSVASTSANASANSGVNIKSGGTFISVTTGTSELTIAAVTGTGATQLAVGNHNHSGTYATNAFSRITVNTTNIDADSTGDTFTITAGTFVSLTPDATNDKMTIGVSTGTSSSTLARGDHNHDTVYVKKSDVITSITSSNSASTNPVSTSVVAENELVMSEALNDLELRKLDITAYTPTDLSNYYTKSETSGASEISTALGGKVNTATTVSTASGLTGGGNLSANRTLGLAAVTVAGYTGSSVTSNTVSYDAYGRISSAASIIYSAVTVSSNLTNVTCPSNITGTSKSGSQAIVIYHNGGSTTDYDISISTTNIISPSGEQVNLTCPKSGYCEVNFLNIGGTIFVRGV